MTQSMFELKIPVPIRTLGATVTIEGELPAFRRGVIYPNWNTDDTGSYWGGTGTLEGPEWDSGRSYFVDDVVEKGGLVFVADDPISAGNDPFLGSEAGGYVGTWPSGGVTFTGVRQSFRVTQHVTVAGITIYGAEAGGDGINPGTKVGIVLPGSSITGSGNYDSYVYGAEGEYAGAMSRGATHIPFNHPMRLLHDGTVYIVNVGDTQTDMSGVFLPNAHLFSCTDPVLDVSENYAGIGPGRNSPLAGSNADLTLWFKLWTTPWHLLDSGIAATVRDPRFEIFIGPSGLDFDSIDDAAFTVLSAVDPTYVGPSSFGGTGPGITRHCFRVKDILPATPANFQSLYIRYAPTNIPADAPNGVAVYNITAEAYVPGYELGAHSTAATFS